MIEDPRFIVSLWYVVVMASTLIGAKLYDTIQDHKAFKRDLARLEGDE